MRILILVVLFAAACGGGGSSGEPSPDSVAPAGEASATPTGERFAKTIPTNSRQTVEGITMTLQGVRLGTPADVFADESDDVRSQYRTTNTIVVVSFEVYNPTSAEASIPAYTGTTALVNDEQLDADFELSEFEVSILPGARVDMQAVFLSERYTPDAIRNIRFVLEKSFSLDGDTSFDFPIAVTN